MPLESSLSQLISTLRTTSGISHKQDIQIIKAGLEGSYAHLDHPNGDDTAAIKSTEGYDLFATEGFLPQFVAQDPWFAGWCGVMVNVSDVAAMGGRPTAIVNALWGTQNTDDTDSNSSINQLLLGMASASKAFGVPIVGGHTNLRDTQSEQPYLSVSILGKAKQLLSSFAAKPEHDLIVAIDLRGRYRAPFLNWNAATTAPVKRLRDDISLLPYIAERGLAFACKDISQAGLLGTCAMLCESSQVGARINLDNIPKPSDVSWLDWLQSFPSFGYLLTTEKNKSAELIQTFIDRGISAACIGDIHSQQQIDVYNGTEKAEFWDFSKQGLTGMSVQSFPSSTST